MNKGGQVSEQNWEVLCRQGLYFFGRVAANMTHEIKNGLAVMNEQSHLLKELLEMAAQGHQPDPERLGQLVERVIKRVADTDAIIKRFNAFAHSADDDLKSLDAGDLLRLMVDLYRRLASLKGVSLEYRPPADAVTLETSPFFLGAAVFDCLEAVAGATPSGGVLSAGLDCGAAEVEFVFQGAEPRNQAPGGGPGPEMLSALGAELAWDAARGALTLKLPREPAGG
jgi:hypothetical protein